MASAPRQRTRVKTEKETARLSLNQDCALFDRLLWSAQTSLFLAAIAFTVYLPSLASDFVYDARAEIFNEGFITSFSNLPAVLSLKVLGMNLLLGDRPGQLFYLMLIAAVWGKASWGYHLCSNLLHACNVGLLFAFLRHLLTEEFRITEVNKKSEFTIKVAAIVATLIFAFHPMAAEPVSAIAYSSDLLVTFFTLLALIGACSFPDKSERSQVLIGVAISICAFLAVTCKESGVAASLILLVYWVLFRQREGSKPWILLLTLAVVLTSGFLLARFYYAPSSGKQLSYLGGSLSKVVWIQPRLWGFMMGKLILPLHLSADYTIENVNGLNSFMTFAFFVLTLVLQICLSIKNRLGALGVAIYWLGLLTVSNFVPLYRILADRFYYLPLVGVAIQIVAFAVIMKKCRTFTRIMGATAVLALLPLTILTVKREFVFASDSALWSDTIHVSPNSSIANNNFGLLLLNSGRRKEAELDFVRALAIDPDYSLAYNNLGACLAQEGELDKAIEQFHKALANNSDFPSAHNNLGNTLLMKGKMDQALAEFQKAININPSFAEAEFNYGNALVKSGHLDEAITHYQAALKIDPDYADAHSNLGVILAQKGQIDRAIVEFENVVRLKPNDLNAQNNLARARATAP